ncbi:MAG: GtrA family protein [Ginsengibacter sp.]
MLTFFKANISSLAASITDYAVTFVAVHFFSMNVVVAGAMGTTTGGLVNFLMGRHWAFNANNMNAVGQVKKYLLVWVGNLLLNASGMYFFTKIGVNYFVTKVLTSLFVGLCYNYPIQKEYVFKTIK